MAGAGPTYLLVVVLQCGQAVAGPTWGALIPRIVGDGEVGRVLALQQSLLAVTAVAGAALAGLVVGAHGTAAALWLDAATFGGLLVAAALVRTRRGGRPAGGPADRTAAASPRPRTLDGLRVLRRDRLVWLVFAWTVPFVIVLEGVNVVEVFLVRDDLGASATAYGVLQGFFGAGAVAGSWLAGRCVSTGSGCALLLARARRYGGRDRRGRGVAHGGLPRGGAGRARGVQRRGQRRVGPALRRAHPGGRAGPGARGVNGVSRTGSVLARSASAAWSDGVLGARQTFVVSGVLALLVVLALVWSLRGVERTAPREAALAPAEAEPALAT